MPSARRRAAEGIRKETSDRDRPDPGSMLLLQQPLQRTRDRCRRFYAGTKAVSMTKILHNRKTLYAAWCDSSYGGPIDLISAPGAASYEVKLETNAADGRTVSYQ